VFALAEMNGVDLDCDIEQKIANFKDNSGTRTPRPAKGK